MTTTNVPTPVPQPISIRAYARRRGTSPTAVSRAIKSGRLQDSLTIVRGVRQIADPALADLEWEQNTDLSKAPGTVKMRAEERAAGATGGRDTRNTRRSRGDVEEYEDISLAEASKREKYWKAAIAELDYRQRAGELIDIEEAQRDAANVARAVLSKLRGVPTAQIDQVLSIGSRQGRAAAAVFLLARIDDALRELASLAEPVIAEEKTA